MVSLDWWALARGLAPIVGLGLATWVSHRVSRAADHQAEAHRASLLSANASDAAALVASLAPGTYTAATLVQLVVAEMNAASGLPTSNVKAIERAAAGAVAKLPSRPIAAP